MRTLLCKKLYFFLTIIVFLCVSAEGSCESLISAEGNEVLSRFALLAQNNRFVAIDDPDPVKASAITMGVNFLRAVQSQGVRSTEDSTYNLQLQQTLKTNLRAVCDEVGRRRQVSLSDLVPYIAQGVNAYFEKIQTSRSMWTTTYLGHGYGGVTKTGAFRYDNANTLCRWS